ncbi:sugar transferase [Roseisolibacter agri]|nr:sugar transferase [Roseisolibacter agri]
MVPRRAGYVGKRALDVALVVLAAPVWLPLLAVGAAVVLATMGRPVFFRQRRAGWGGMPFDILKLRTMTDARGADGALLPDAERLPAAGRWLRRTSLDELPELLTVLRGDMSLVGPRPLLLQYLPLYSAAHARRHELRPGLTGLAQVSGRNALDWPSRFDLDVDYVDRCSPALDARILWQTVRAVFGGRGVSAEGEATMSVFTGYGAAAPEGAAAPPVTRAPVLRGAGSSGPRR